MTLYTDYNPRHLRNAIRDAVRPVNYFREWKEDTIEITSAMFKHDWEHMMIQKMIEDPIELKKIRNEIVVNFKDFIEIYHYLQSRSKTYPWV